jgi:hypothetical protein
MAATKAKRSMRWHPEQCRLVIRQGREVRGYIVMPERLAPGVAEVTYTRLAGEPGEALEEYRVACRPSGLSCSCKGFRHWRKCKHASSLAVLCERGLLS